MTTMTLDQIRAKGLQALSQKLGPVGMVRFLQQNETGTGDYSRDRHRNIGKKSVSSLAKQLAARRSRP